VRGPAEILDDGLVVFADHDRLEGYDWAIAAQLPYDLAAIRHAADILGFVRRWGFLHDAEDEEAALPTVEEFEYEAVRIGYVLYLYALLARRGDPATERALVEYWLGVYEGALSRTREWLWHPDNRPISADDVTRHLRTADLNEMAIDVREALEESLWNYLPAVEVSVRSLDFAEWATDEPEPPGEFLLTSLPRDLLSRAYLEVALEMTAGVPVAACPEDHRMFAVRDPRQIYCSSQCAGRARFRRFANRRRTGS
jgi:hypothetical protein